MKDGLAILMRSAKRSSDPSNSHHTNSNSKKARTRAYGTCPVCQRSVPQACIDMHVQSCLDNSAAPQASDVMPGSAQVGPGQQPEQQAQHPQTAQQHYVLHPPAAPPSHSSDCTVQNTTYIPQLRMPSAQQAPTAQHTEATQAPLPGPSQTPRKNAFSHLMQAASAQQQQHVFYLERHEGGWRCHWWQKGVGQPPPGLPKACWSASMQLKETTATTPASPITASGSAATQLPYQSGMAADHDVDTIGADQSDPVWTQGVISETAPDTHHTQVVAEQLDPSPDQLQSQPSQRTSTASQSSPGSVGGQKRPTGQLGPVKVTLHLRTNVPPADGGVVDWRADLPSTRVVPPEGRWQGLPSGLKSALQKCVRLGRAGPAVRLTLQMLKTDPGEVLRRLPVICLEDSILHPHLPIVVWLMAANAKGYQLGVTHVASVLHFTYQMASATVLDNLPPPNMCPGAPMRSMSDVDAAMGHLGQHESVLVKSMLLRAHFGGMKGDMVMMKGYASYWAARFLHTAVGPPPLPAAPSSFVPASQLCPGPWVQTAATQLSAAGPLHQGPHVPLSPLSWMAFVEGVHALPGPVPTQIYNIHEIGPVRKSDIPLSAIDHHVSEVLPHLLNIPEVQQAAARVTEGSWGHEGDAMDCLRSAMWLFRSSTNHRRWLPALYPVSKVHPSSSKAQTEHFTWEGDRERDQSHKARLQPLWDVALPRANQFSAMIISQRMRPVHR